MAGIFGNSAIGGSGSTIETDSKAISTRPTDYHTEAALDRRSGVELWNKFGFNNDVDIGTEVVASWGGTFNPLTTATTLTIVSTSGDDTSGGSDRDWETPERLSKAASV